MLTYEDYFTPEAVAAFKYVKRGQMMLAEVQRAVLADIMNARIPLRGKQFLYTERGTWRMAARHNSDNTTEIADYEDRGAQLVVMSDPRSLGTFFALHGADPEAYLYLFNETVRTRLGEALDD